MSVYLWDSEGMTLRNRAILEKAGLQARAFQGPWIIAGDFNMTPEELEDEAGDLVRRIGGVVVRPAVPTCKSASGGRTIDYCIIDARMAGAVASINVDEDFPSSPHSPLRLRIRGAAVKEYVQVLRRPVCFEVCKPIGCMRRPRALNEAAAMHHPLTQYRPMKQSMKL